MSRRRSGGTRRRAPPRAGGSNARPSRSRGRRKRSRRASSAALPGSSSVGVASRFSRHTCGVTLVAGAGLCLAGGEERPQGPARRRRGCVGEPWVPPRWVGELWLVLEEVAPDGPATEAERNPVDECLASLLLNPVPPGSLRALHVTPVGSAGRRSRALPDGRRGAGDGWHAKKEGARGGTLGSPTFISGFAARRARSRARSRDVGRSSVQDLLRGQGRRYRGHRNGGSGRRSVARPHRS